MKDHSNFLNYIQNYIKENPEAAGYVSDFVVKGIQDSRREVIERAADMEAALLFSVTKNIPNKDSFILGKLNKWKDKSVCNWTGTIEMLENKVNKE